MRLLKVRTWGLEEFHDADNPLYAVLSHRWAEDEVLLQDIQTDLAPARSGFRKLQFLRSVAEHDQLSYCWVDTCCIDRRNSKELSDAINSMLRWYEQASRCYVFLGDFADVSMSVSASMSDSHWFKRGWTLQELLATTVMGIHHDGPALYAISSSQIDLKDRQNLESHSVQRLQEYFAPRIKVDRFELRSCEEENEAAEPDRFAKFDIPTVSVTATSDSVYTRPSTLSVLGPSRGLSDMARHDTLLFCTELMKFLEEVQSDFALVALTISCVANAFRPLSRSELLEALYFSRRGSQPEHALSFMLTAESSIFIANSTDQIYFRHRAAKAFIQNFAIAGLDASHRTLLELCQISVEEEQDKYSLHRENITTSQGFITYARQYLSSHANMYATHNSVGIHGSPTPCTSGIASPSDLESENFSSASSTTSSPPAEWVVLGSESDEI